MSGLHVAVLVFLCSLFGQVCMSQLLTQEAYVKASNTAAGNNFGSSVSISGDGNTIAVGAPFEGSGVPGISRTGTAVQGSAPKSGAVYVYVMQVSGWTLHSFLKASNAARDNLFGSSVALSSNGKVLFVGAPGERSPAQTINGDPTQGTLSNYGAVYEFRLSDATSEWFEVNYIKPSTPGPDFRFGFSLSCSGAGDVLAAGAPGGDFSSGFVSTFWLDSVTKQWKESTRLAIPGFDNLAALGTNVALSGDGRRLAIIQQRGGNSPYLNRIRLFEVVPSNQWVLMPGCTWGSPSTTEISLFLGNDNLFNAEMACAWNFDGSRLAFAWSESSFAVGVNPSVISPGGAMLSGAVRVYKFDSQRRASIDAFLKASNCYPNSLFCSSVAFNGKGDMLIVGSKGESSAGIGVNGADLQGTAALNTGAVYVFSNVSGNWTQIEYIKSLMRIDGQRFGAAVSLSLDGSRMIVGAPFESGNGTLLSQDIQSQTQSASGTSYTFQNGCSTLLGMSPGSDKSVCASSSVALEATSGAGMSGRWNGFEPGNISSVTDPKALFTPHARQYGRDILLTWTVGTCSKTVTVSVATAPIASATSFSTEMCSTSTMQLSSSFGGSAIGGSWSGFEPGSLSPSFPFTVFTPNPTQAGSTVNLVWTTRNPSSCPSASATVSVLVYPAASISAGESITVCGVNPTPIQLEGNFSGAATNVEWSKFLPGGISDVTNPRALFTPHISQMGKSVKLMLTNTAAKNNCALASPSSVTLNLFCDARLAGTSLSTGSIVGIVIGAIAGVVCIIIVAIVLYKKWNASLVNVEGDYQLMQDQEYKF